MKQSLFHTLNGYAHIFLPTGSCHGPWNSRLVSLVWPLLASQSSTRRLTMDFCMWSPGGEVGTFAFETISPALLGTCNGVYERSRVGNQRMSLQKCANLSGCTDLLAHALPGYRVFVLLSMSSGEIYLKLKPCLFVKISYDIVTEYCCKFAFCLWRFSALPAGCVLTWW